MSSTGKLTLKDLATADGSSATITLQSGDTDIDTDDELGGIFFQALMRELALMFYISRSGYRCDGRGRLGATSNATKISFRCGNSETVRKKAKDCWIYW